MKKYLDYDCKVPHHENEEMGLRLEYSPHHEDVTIDIEVDNGLGFDGKKSRITLTASELREITFITNKYIDARNVMEMQGGANGNA